MVNLPKHEPQGHEQEGLRPGIIVAVPSGYLRYPIVLVVPVTSQSGNWANQNPILYHQIPLHELTHFRRKDFMVNGLMVLLKIIHWYNPLVWYGFYRMRQDSEIACDAQALSRLEPEERLGYGYTIVRLLSLARPQRVPGLIGIITGQSTMKRRILMISSFKESSSPESSGRWFSLHLAPSPSGEGISHRRGD